MQKPNKQCHTLPIKSQKQHQMLRLRSLQPLPNTPAITLGKCQNQLAVVWTQNIQKHPLAPLKDLSSGSKAFSLAKTIAKTCEQLTKLYGYFMINQNMVFQSQNKDLLVWINPNILQSSVKIYLPPTNQGQKAMIRSIVSYLKLWLRCDYQVLTKSNNLPQLYYNLEKMSQGSTNQFRYRISQDVAAERSLSVNLNMCNIKARKIFQAGGFMGGNMKKIYSLNSARKNNLSISPQYQPQNTLRKKEKAKPCSPTPTRATVQTLKYKLNTKPTPSRYVSTAADTQMQQTDQLTTTTLHQASTKNKSNNSIGKTYFPNKTTSNHKNHIVQMIMAYDTSPHDFGKNNIVLDEQKFRQLEEQKMKRLKASIHAFGDEFDHLFESNVVDKNGIDVSQINREFLTILQ